MPPGAINGVWTIQGARLTYSGNTFTWVSNATPSGWGTVSDADSVPLPNGNYMQANRCTPQNAIFNGPNSWLATGSVLQSSDESGFTLLTNDKVLTVDGKFQLPLPHERGSGLRERMWAALSQTT